MLLSVFLLARVPFIHSAILLLTPSQITAAMSLYSGITIDGKERREPMGDQMMSELGP